MATTRLKNTFKKNRPFLKKCAVLLLLILIFVPIMSQAVEADPLRNLQSTGLGTGNGGDLKVIIGSIVKVFLGFMGIVMVILIIYAGFLWMTAAGDEKKVDKAKDILKSAVIGLIILLAAYAIAAFVITKTQTAVGTTTSGQ